MKIHSINTGSSGNCYLVQYEPNKILMLDCGVPSNMILDYMRRNHLSPVMVKFCLISHLHIDHLHDSKFINSFSVPIYFPKINKKNQPQSELHKNLVNYCGEFENDKFIPFEDKRIVVEPFRVPHDDIPTFGYKITLPDKKKLVYMTDFGNIRDLPDFKDKIDIWMIECNYDEITIEKDHSVVAVRSKKDDGHCSNRDCFNYLSRQKDLTDTKILLVHKSSERFNDKIGYKIFEDLKCKAIEICGHGTKHTNE